MFCTLYPGACIISSPSSWLKKKKNPSLSLFGLGVAFHAIFPPMHLAIYSHPVITSQCSRVGHIRAAFKFPTYEGEERGPVWKTRRQTKPLGWKVASETAEPFQLPSKVASCYRVENNRVQQENRASWIDGKGPIIKTCACFFFCPNRTRESCGMRLCLPVTMGIAEMNPESSKLVKRCQESPGWM